MVLPRNPIQCLTCADKNGGAVGASIETPKASTGKGNGPVGARGRVERRKLPQRILGLSPSRERVLVHFGPEKRI